MPKAGNGEPTTKPRPRSPWRLYVTFFLGWIFASVMILGAVTTDEADTQARTAAWFFVAGTGILVVALVYRDRRARTQSQKLLDERQALIESIGVVTDPRLSQLPLYRLLDELLARARTVVRADIACVYLHDKDTGRLERSASSGLGDGGAAPVAIELGEGVIGRVAVSRRGVALAETPKDPAIPPNTASLLAAPLIAEGQLVGVLELGTAQRRQFGDNDVRLLQLVADRAAVAIEGRRLEQAAQRSTLAAEGARQRLALLADSGEVLARSFDRVDELAVALGDALVPTFVDWFAFHQLDTNGTLRVLASRAGPDVGTTELGTWDEAVTSVLHEGEPVLAWGDQLTEDRFLPARSRELTSVLLVPVHARDLVLGAITFGTAGRRRGLRSGDVSTAADLAARVAVAIERVLLAAQTQQSAVRAARHATQLQRLTEAAFAVNAALDTSALAAVVSEQAARILDADAAWVELTTGKRAQRVGHFGVDPTRGRTAVASLTDAVGASVGSISVARTGRIYSADEKAVLRSLAQIASVALANARLYGTVQASEARMRALYDASPVGIVELDASGRAARWNRAAESLFGWPPFSEKVASKLKAPEAAQAVVATALADDVPTAVDVRLGDVEAELVAVPLREAGGATRGAVLAAVDLTERKHVAEQLQHAQRMEAMARMAGGIAHDFNNVLMVITGYADLLLRRDVDDDTRADVESMRAAAKRAAEFTRKLLTISRRQVVQAQVVDVTAAVRSLQDVLPVMLGDAITLDLLVEDPPPVLIDPAQLEQLLLNLAINAKDAMPDGGTLTIRARALEDDGLFAQLVIGDTGEGMDPETVEHCFEPFFTTKDRTKGTGLGLSTAYGVVTQSGGEITVESARGVGTTFTIRLPAASEATPVEERPLGAGDEALRILVVDDDPDVRAIVADMLELDGHDVVAAADGRAALKVLKDATFDILLTDVVMPRMRGTDLATRAVKQQPGLQVVLMSSHVDDPKALEGVEGALFLAKPFSPAALADIITACRGRS